MKRWIPRFAPHLVGAALFLLFPPPSARAVPPGYFVDSAQVAEVRPTWRDRSDGDFTFSVRREFPDSAAARLLAIAESCYPPRERLVGIAATEFHEMGSDTANVPLWWCDGPGARRVPYAVTAGTLDHFLALTEGLRDRRLRAPGARALFSSKFLYRAAIEARATHVSRGIEFEDVWVASIRASWSYDDGTFVPSFEARRTVVLNAAGDVLAIEGDGEAVENVTFSSHRGVGRVEERR